MTDEPKRRIISSEQAGYRLRKDPPMSAATARAALRRAGIKAVRGYWENEVDELVAQREARDDSRG